MPSVKQPVSLPSEVVVKKVILFSVLLIAGLLGSQIIPRVAGSALPVVAEIISIVTLLGLSFIMIHVGYEFEINKSAVRSYGWDYLVAMTAAAFPWILVALYFVFVMLPASVWGEGEAWTQVLLAARFAAPTSAGVLFSMLTAAGLGATWLFRKARVLAIFDDLDTVLLMIPLKMLIVGPAWQLTVVVAVMMMLLWVAWRYLHRLEIPITWPYVLGYSAVLVAVTEAFHYVSLMIDAHVPIHIEVLLPAFVLGCIMKRPPECSPHDDDAQDGCMSGPETPEEQRVSTIISSIFILFVGLNMPAIFGVQAASGSATTITAQQPMPGLGVLLGHVLLVTLLANLGKMFPAFCYRREAHWKERLALSVGMWPRGEVGAGILVISLAYGLGGPIITVAALSLALNLVLTGVFIWIVKRLLASAQVSKVS